MFSITRGSLEFNFWRRKPPLLKSVTSCWCISMSSTRLLLRDVLDEYRWDVLDEYLLLRSFVGERHCPLSVLHSPQSGNPALPTLPGTPHPPSGSSQHHQCQLHPLILCLLLALCLLVRWLPLQYYTQKILRCPVGQSSSLCTTIPAPLLHSSVHDCLTWYAFFALSSIHPQTFYVLIPNIQFTLEKEYGRFVSRDVCGSISTSVFLKPTQISPFLITPSSHHEISVVRTVSIVQTFTLYLWLSSQ